MLHPAGANRSTPAPCRGLLIAVCARRTLRCVVVQQSCASVTFTTKQKHRTLCNDMVDDPTNRRCRPIPDKETTQTRHGAENPRRAKRLRSNGMVSLLYQRLRCLRLRQGMLSRRSRLLISASPMRRSPGRRGPDSFRREDRPLRTAGAGPIDAAPSWYPAG